MPYRVYVCGVMQSVEDLDKVPESKLGYLEWHELAEWRTKKGYTQIMCEVHHVLHWSHKRCEQCA